MTSPGENYGTFQYVRGVLIFVLVMGVIGGLLALLHDATRQPRPATHPPAPLVKVPVPRVIGTPRADLAGAADDYARTLPDAFAGLASRIRAGEIADKSAAFDFTKAHAQPLATAIDRAFAAHSDPDGRITDPAGLADEIDAAARATRR